MGVNPGVYQHGKGVCEVVCVSATPLTELGYLVRKRVSKGGY